VRKLVGFALARHLSLGTGHYSLGREAETRRAAGAQELSPSRRAREKQRRKKRRMTGGIAADGSGRVRANPTSTLVASERKLEIEERKFGNFPVRVLRWFFAENPRAR
jgi:hypothetical protein